MALVSVFSIAYDNIPDFTNQAQHAILRMRRAHGTLPFCLFTAASYYGPGVRQRKNLQRGKVVCRWKQQQCI